MTVERREWTGRLIAKDERDARFPMRAALPRRVALPSFRHWSCGPVRDQGPTAHCVGYAAVAWLEAMPRRTLTGPKPEELYDQAQREFDEWEGVEPDYYGTSVRAVAKALQARGHLASYVWARTAEEVRDWILLNGTVIVGTNWYPEMDEPDRRQFLTVPPPTGRVAPEGHAYLLVGFSGTLNAFRMLNSWGDWGQKGRAWIRFVDMERLLREDGEACAGVEQAITPRAA